MENAVQTFPADLAGDKTSFISGLVLLFAGGVGMAYLLTRKSSRDRNRQMLATMLLFFLALIGLAMTSFSAMSLQRLTPVRIYAYGIETPYGYVAFREIQDAYIRSGKGTDPLASSARYEVLVILTGEKPHVLSGKTYPIREIFSSLKNAVPKKTE